MKKIIYSIKNFYILVPLILLLIIIKCHVNDIGASAKVGTSIEITPLFLDFGYTPISSYSDEIIEIKNIGDSKLIINPIAKSDLLKSQFKLVNDKCSSQILNPGNSCVLKIRFLPDYKGFIYDSFDIPLQNANIKKTFKSHVIGTSLKPTETRLTFLEKSNNISYINSFEKNNPQIHNNHSELIVDTTYQGEYIGIPPIKNHERCKDGIFSSTIHRCTNAFQFFQESNTFYDKSDFINFPDE